MILPDANLLIYAYDASSPKHDRARAWLERVLSGEELVLLAWASVLAFVRITTNSRAFASPFTIEEAVSIVSEWIEVGVVRTIGPTDLHWTHLAHLLVDGQAQGPLASDAHLAALAIEHGAVLYTTDRDFARFGGLAYTNPL